MQPREPLIHLSLVVMITNLPPELIVWIGRLAHVEDAVALGLTCRSLFETLLKDTYSRRRVYHGASSKLLIKNGVWDMLLEYKTAKDEVLAPEAFLVSTRNFYTPAWDALVERLCKHYNTPENGRIVLSPDLLCQVAAAEQIWLDEMFPFDNHTFILEFEIWMACARHALFAGNPEAYIHLMKFAGIGAMLRACMNWLKEGHEVVLGAVKLLSEDENTRNRVADHVNRSGLTSQQKKRVYAQWPADAWVEAFMLRRPWLVFVPVVVVSALLWYFDVDLVPRYVSSIVTAAFSFSLYARINRV